MSQEEIWDREYKKSKFLTKENKPQADVVRFVKFLKEKNKFLSKELKVLDLGSGIGRNSYYFAELGAQVVGIEISKTALNIAKNNMSKGTFDIEYIKGSIGDKGVYNKFQDNYFDIILDITSSNSLNEEEREIYLKESKRILKPEGYFFVKALCKDGDQNAKYLLKNFSGKEKDTYIMPQTHIVEKVWSEKDFKDFYGRYFSIIKLEKKTNYSLIEGRSYKRNFWICYMKK